MISPEKDDTGKETTKKGQVARVTMSGVLPRGRAGCIPADHPEQPCADRLRGETRQLQWYPVSLCARNSPARPALMPSCSPSHLDHCALIPLLYKYGYEGPFYSTPPTRDLSAMLRLDYLDVIHKEDRKVPYSSNEVKTYIRQSITLNYGSVTELPRISNSPSIMPVTSSGSWRLPISISGNGHVQYCIYRRSQLQQEPPFQPGSQPVSPPRGARNGEHLRGVQ